ncbi:MAG: hypothetical protein Cons2KO_16420 [Congregibacter sp.]
MMIRSLNRQPLVPTPVSRWLVAVSASLFAAGSIAADEKTLLEHVVDAMEFRSIGPAVTGGRIADIEVHPSRAGTWYLGVGSGGVWKTENAGTTWKPLFDGERSYSIGEVTLDPSNPDTVWVGTGENVSGRHVAWGDGVYRSLDGGTSWQAMGLERSEHIGRILVDPDNLQHVLVAAEGPLWSSGGERGVYRSLDGGESWTRVLEIDDNTGATDLEFHPTDASVVYAATYERRRTVWSFLAGGPGSGIWKSTDGGASWREITQGLPTSDDALEVGKIGLAVTPADPDRVYATIEANDGEQGFYVSFNRGESWTRQSEYISGGTGPHYYQEIEASPHDPDRVYQMDVFMHATSDAGKHFKEVGTGREKHSDNHALWIDPQNGKHLLVGTDAGLFESFDVGSSWRHFPNLPISQFYKVAVSNHEPFYEVLAGAQDLGTLHGPSRTLNVEGVRNQDWNVPYGADGYGVAFDPFDETLLYQMSQRGNLLRYHVPSGENVTIRPLPAPGDAPERWNWDSPLETSVHKAGRIYFASQRVWRSDDRGDSWQAVSGDLTSQGNRFELPVNGRVHSVDALWDLGAMSGYASLTGLAESPVDAQTLWVGSDDGLVHVTRNGGADWLEVTPPLPERAFINAVEASSTDPDGAFVMADNHKTGDYRPLLFATSDGGKSWRDISGDLPDDIIVWAIQQDHVEPKLLFLGAENGVYVSVDGGTHWQRLSAGMPTVSFRDLKIQRRDSDLVAASFGRGIYVLDDYRALRALAADSSATLDDESYALFPVRDSWWYVPSVPGQAKGLPTRGSTDWRGANPPLGAVFTVFVGKQELSAKEQRREAEKEQAARGDDIAFPGWNTLQDEDVAPRARLFVEILNANLEPVRLIALENEVGAKRVSWNMRGSAPDAIKLDKPDFQPPWMSDPIGPLMAPGTYFARLIRVADGAVEIIAPEQSFALRAVPNLPEDVDPDAVAEFQQSVASAMRRLNAVKGEVAEVRAGLRFSRVALDAAPAAPARLYADIDQIEAELAAIDVLMRGNPARARLSEFTVYGVADRLSEAAKSFNTRLQPTAAQRESLVIGLEGLDALETRVAELQQSQVARLRKNLRDAGAPWAPRQ